MDRSICYFHAAGLPRQKKVNVVGFTVRCLHIYTREIFPVAKVLQAIIVYPYQVESEILSLMFDMKLAVAALFGFGLDVLFYSSGDISLAHLLFGSAFLRMFCCAFTGMLWMLL